MLAARAGMDVLLCSARDVGQGTSTVAALAEQVRARHGRDRDECQERFAAALARVLRLRARLTRGSA